MTAGRQNRTAGQRGRQGERLAAEYLSRLGWTILAANYRCRYGEIDLVARTGEMVVFVEVKLRKDDRFSPAAAAVTPAKRLRLRRAASLWLAEQDCADPARFDVVEIYTRTGQIRRVENAFE